MFKKSKIALVVAAVVATVTLSGCFAGNPKNPDQNFAALKTFNKWNNSWEMTDSAEANKWINAVLGFFPGCIGYWLCTAGDVLIFNTMGFWSGDNPLASATTTVDGVEYSIVKTDTTLTITDLSTNESAEFAICDDGKTLRLAPVE